MHGAASRNITVDSVITERDALLVAVYLTATAAGTATATVYNGVDTNGRKIHTLSTPASRSEKIEPVSPIRCDEGIFIDVGNNVEGVCVVWQYPQM